MQKHEIKVKDDKGGEYIVSLSYYFKNSNDLTVVNANGLDAKIKAGAPKQKMIGNSEMLNKADLRTEEQKKAGAKKAK